MILLFCVMMLAGPLGLGQQPQEQPTPAQAKPSPSASPSPDTAQYHREANAQIQSDLNSVFSSDPALSGAKVQATVDDLKIDLTGTVQTQAQVERVMELVSPYAKERKVVNQLTRQ